MEDLNGVLVATTESPSFMVDYTRLHRLSYLLTFDKVTNLPVFTRIADYQIMHDRPLYCDTVIDDVSSLLSYRCASLKSTAFSVVPNK